MKKIVPALLLFFLTNASCKKVSEALPVSKENIVGTWQLTAKRMSATGIPEQDAYPNMEECEKDNLYYFNVDYSFAYMDAGATCDMSEPVLGFWELHEKVITFLSQTGSITKFDGTYMEVMTQVTYATTGTVYITKYSFRKI